MLLRVSDYVTNRYTLAKYFKRVPDEHVKYMLKYVECPIQIRLSNNLRSLSGDVCFDSRWGFTYYIDGFGGKKLSPYIKVYIWSGIRYAGREL